MIKLLCLMLLTQSINFIVVESIQCYQCTYDDPNCDDSMITNLTPKCEGAACVRSEIWTGGFFPLDERAYSVNRSCISTHFGLLFTLDQNVYYKHTTCETEMCNGVPKPTTGSTLRRCFQCEDAECLTIVVEQTCLGASCFESIMRDISSSKVERKRGCLPSYVENEYVENLHGDSRTSVCNSNLCNNGIIKEREKILCYQCSSNYECGLTLDKQSYCFGLSCMYSNMTDQYGFDWYHRGCSSNYWADSCDLILQIGNVSFPSCSCNSRYCNSFGGRTTLGTSTTAETTTTRTTRTTTTSPSTIWTTRTTTTSPSTIWTTKTTTSDPLVAWTTRTTTTDLLATWTTRTTTTSPSTIWTTRTTTSGPLVAWTTRTTTTGPSTTPPNISCYTCTGVESCNVPLYNMSTCVGTFCYRKAAGNIVQVRMCLPYYSGFPSSDGSERYCNQPLCNSFEKSVPSAKKFSIVVLMIVVKIYFI